MSVLSVSPSRPNEEDQLQLVGPAQSEYALVSLHEFLADDTQQQQQQQQEQQLELVVAAPSEYELSDLQGFLVTVDVSPMEPDAAVSAGAPQKSREQVRRRHKHIEQKGVGEEEEQQQRRRERLALEAHLQSAGTAVQGTRYVYVPKTMPQQDKAYLVGRLAGVLLSPAQVHQLRLNAIADAQGRTQPPNPMPQEAPSDD